MTDKQTSKSDAVLNEAVKGLEDKVPAALELIAKGLLREVDRVRTAVILTETYAQVAA
jgi:hypothetical protein